MLPRRDQSSQASKLATGPTLPGNARVDPKTPQLFHTRHRDVRDLIWVGFSALLGSTFGQMAAAFGALFVVFAILALAVAASFFWFIKLLRSPAVKNELV